MARMGVRVALTCFGRDRRPQSLTVGVYRDFR
jgi:hypothetical protein